MGDEGLVKRMEMERGVDLLNSQLLKKGNSASCYCILIFFASVSPTTDKATPRQVSVHVVSKDVSYTEVTANHREDSLKSDDLSRLETSRYIRKRKDVMKKEVERGLYMPTPREWSKKQQCINKDAKRYNKIVSRMRALQMYVVNDINSGRGSRQGSGRRRAGGAGATFYKVVYINYGIIKHAGGTGQAEQRAGRGRGALIFRILIVCEGRGRRRARGEGATACPTLLFYDTAFCVT
ncbi:hypothetical protein EVAR_76318_1 [Eumeta japonica]|uniref:Uncharacterized protein n=1 Tax=Eumeta variegata TaxID=151549 RepID=A0A4C1T7Q2_EUMVA|nr:hypothetical protein EVAR_76318_1 [Eumeta japonica]